uniref:ABM domain-containing protein n=1 Tax=Neovison vison TaxID=452646 RepID=A0A8C7EK15_NEOVI
MSPEKYLFIVEQGLQSDQMSALSTLLELDISIQKLSNESRYIIYEFWENSSVWNSHLQTNYSKTFQRSNVDFLETPELTSTMLVPASWWILNN